MQKNGVKVLIFILVMAILIAGGGLAYKIYQDQNNIGSTEEVANEKMEQEKKIQIYQGNDRPIAVMIDNHKDAWPQANLNKAYLVYEIVVEGGETRLMACFKGVNLDKIGPVRSARHYFIDYAMENDAIYTHFGWSPQAEKDIKKYSIDNLNGISEKSDTFWRVKDKASPHNAVTSTDAILSASKTKGYETTSKEKSVLNYVADEVELENGISATTITIPHSNLQTVKYEYDETSKRYNRYARGVKQVDWDTKEPVSTKNIIIVKCDNYTLEDKENKGRQGLKNIGTFDGYYITNGKAIKITAIKEDRDSKTVYKDSDGNVINVNDGNTFIHICPRNAEIGIEGIEEPAETQAKNDNTVNS